MLGQPMPACEPIGRHPKFQPFVWILHMTREKLWWAAAHIIARWDKREVRSRDIHIIQMAVPAVHENEIACQANAICA